MAISRSTTLLAGILVLLMGIWALTFAAGPASARSWSTATSFGFYSGSPDAFLGQVASNNDQCRSGRLVKLYRERGSRDRLIGRDRAGSTGQWEIERGTFVLARYYALIPRKKFGPQGRHTCRQYKSSTLRFGG